MKEDNEAPISHLRVQSAVDDGQIVHGAPRFAVCFSQHVHRVPAFALDSRTMLTFTVSSSINDTVQHTWVAEMMQHERAFPLHQQRTLRSLSRNQVADVRWWATCEPQKNAYELLIIKENACLYFTICIFQGRRFIWDTRRLIWAIWV